MMGLREITDQRKLHSAWVAGALLHRPHAHPVWHTYLVSMVHLRAVADLPAPQLVYADSSHEIAIFALAPDSKPDPADVKTIVPLHPGNLFYQLRGKSDDAALAVFRAFTAALASGELNPDTDHRRHTLAWLDRWVRAQ
jgi:hypothetical protein